MNVERDFASYVEAELQHVPPLRPGALQEAFEQVAVDSQHQPRDLGTQSPKWRFQSMFNATKFVVAGAIVALLGGFLLSSVLTQPGEDPVPAVGATTTPQAATAPAIELPAKIPEGIESGKLDTPLGAARWVHLMGDETTLPRQLGGMLTTSAGYLVLEEGYSSPIKLWTSPDLITWASEPLDIDARSGELSRSGSTYWLNTSDPGGLWRSQDAVAWEQVSVDGLEPPGPEGFPWALSVATPIAGDGTTIVPFGWHGDYGVMTRDLALADEVHDFFEIEPGVYQLVNYGLEEGQLPAVRVEATDGGMRIVDHLDGTELKVVDGVDPRFIDRLLSGDVVSVGGLGIVADGTLLGVEPGGDFGRSESYALAFDDDGFVAYSRAADGLVHVHRSQDGHDWINTDVIGDDADEPSDIEGVWTEGGSVWVYTEQSDYQATSNGLFERISFDGGFPVEGGRVRGPMDTTGDPVFTPDDGLPVPFDITATRFNQRGCGGGSEQLLSPNTMASSVDDGRCNGGIREALIITFDDLPA